VTRRRVGVVGASGFGGAELVRLITAHPDLDLALVAAHSRAGERLDGLAPNLVTDIVLAEVDPAALAALDLVLLATPHEASLELVPDLVARGVRVIDLSGAYRLDAGDFADWYGQPHTSPRLARDGSDAAVYGLPELHRDRIAGAALVANPGCYPTASVLALAPLASLVVAGSIVIDAKSGTSGAGRSSSDALSASIVHGDLVAYGAPTHRHTREIESALTAVAATPLGPVSFTPHLVPMSRGLLATCYATLAPGVGAADVATALEDHYAAEPFVHVLAPGTWPHTKALTGSNGCRVSAIVDERTGRVVVAGAIDNLGKGAAGQAVQNANLMLGLAETTGLTAEGVFP